MTKLSAPWGNVQWHGRQAVGVVFALVALFIVILLLGLAWLSFLGFVLYWNIGDIVREGANFWNVLWIVLASLGILAALFGNRGAKA